MSRNKKDLNDVTAAPFLVAFSQLKAAKNNKNGTAVTSLRSFLFHDDFTSDDFDSPSVMKYSYCISMKIDKLKCYFRKDFTAHCCWLELATLFQKVLLRIRILLQYKSVYFSVHWVLEFQFWVYKIDQVFPTKVGEYYLAQRPRIDLSKRFLPKPNTTTALKLTPHRYNISKN